MSKKSIMLCTATIVGLLFAHLTFGEATMLRTGRINWSSGQVSVIWGQRSGASGKVLSIDELALGGWSGPKNYVPSVNIERAGGRVAVPANAIAASFVLGLIVAAFLRSRSTPHSCPSCGYPLADLPTTTCPECGTTTTTCPECGTTTTHA